jgi:site-specific DNA-methyltransferase (cytosine-N4-specific)
MSTVFASKTLERVNWDFTGVKTGFSTHGIHPYPAKYIPQIPASLIQELSEPGERVADIFCGSGTTLVEALSLGRNAVGVDANPLACLISEVKTSRLSTEEKRSLEDVVTRAKALASEIGVTTTGLFTNQPSFISTAPRPQSEALAFWFEPFVVEELAEALAWCDALPTETSNKVARVALSAIIVAVSKQDSDTRYVRRDKNIPPGETLRRFARSLASTVEAISGFNHTLDPELRSEVHRASLLTRPDIGMVDLVVCSPPYPNAYSYHLYHRTRMEWLGMDQPKFKKEEIGSHRKYSSPSKNGATIETFRSEMDIIFDWLRSHLREKRYACFVVGNSTIRGESVDNAKLLADVAAARGFREVARLNRTMQDTKKAFNPAHGKIKTEQIVILQNAQGAQA